MAQTGFTPIVTYNTATATTVPSAANLAQGELAVNVTDKKLYTKDSGGNVVLLASNGGDVTGPASSTNLAIPTFSGTGGKTLLDNSGVTISAGVITATGFSGPLTGNVTGNVSGSSGSCTGNASTVTTNANLTGPITSVGNATSIASQTGTGTTFAMSASPTFTGTVGAADLTTTGNTILGNASTDTLNVGNGGLIKDASGNVGIGVTPSAWVTYKAVQVGNTSLSTSSASGTTAYITGNGYYNGTNWIYQANDYASRYACLYGNGTHAWFTAPSGTAGNTISFTQAMTLNASGWLGIGSTSPSTLLHLRTSASGLGVSQIFENSSGTEKNWLIGRNNTTGFEITPSTVAGGLTFSTPAVVVDASGGLKTLNTIGVGNATPSTSGAGITFPATQSASTNANTLDDYEEGTWTPADASGAGLTFTGVSASYTKIGRLVSVQAKLTFPATADVSAASIGGLPFASTADTAGYQKNNNGLVAGLLTFAGATQIQIIIFSTGGQATNVQCTSCTFILNMTYYV